MDVLRKLEASQERCLRLIRGFFEENAPEMTRNAPVIAQSTAQWPETRPGASPGPASPSVVDIDIEVEEDEAFQQ